ncbi:MAG: hypothetical protein FWC92_04615 [Defluviitaleaceae bacterium]|nr:hypothetical protein [Defluviitaleaceae bacterium]
MKICINGSWQFQPMAVPENYARETGEPPHLPRPTPHGWSNTPIRIPSPWNGNTWGNGRVDRSDATQRYHPDSVYYPSYPQEWDHAEMGWLRRSFTVPESWQGMRISILFEAVMGHAQVFVNGHNVGEHFDGYLPFELDITRAITTGENTLEVGVRRLHLYDKQSTKYKKMRAPYAHGSNTMGLGGIWQDVWLLAKPKVFISDVFVKPLLDIDTLEMDVTVNNDSDTTMKVTIEGAVHSANGVVMPLTSRVLLLRPHSSATIVCKDLVAARLEKWSPDTPNLYTVKWNISNSDYEHTTRFGWRQLKLLGQELLLNGESIRLVADICHPFGPHIFTRAHIISWYNLVKSVGGNAVRLHAQIHPRIFLEIADEMGIMVLDETAIFGSCLALNFEEDIAWQRYEEHFEGMILRDRNHPCVFGWSFGNELFAIFLYDDAAKRDQGAMYARIFELGNRAHKLDPTREFVTCDGDEDLQGTLPIWSKHYGHGLRDLPTGITKPIVVGENGGTYYAKPRQLAEFNGEQAYENYAGRNTALGIDLYNNIRHFEGKLVYFSPSELVWFGLQQLPYGFKDFDRLPNLTDGIFVNTFSEGRPGIYIERIPPYVGTLNPGFDPSLPEYIALDMYHGMKDALKQDPSYDVKWKPRHNALEAPRIPALKGDVKLIEITCEADLAQLPLNAQLTNRPATMLKRSASHPWVDCFSIADMYFAECEDKHVLHHGLCGEILQKGTVLLTAGDTDWSLFNNIPECAKCGAIAMYEQHIKPSGAALVILPYEGNTLVVTTIRKTPDTAAFYKQLMTNMGLEVPDINEANTARDTAHDLLLHGPVDVTD